MPRRVFWLAFILINVVLAGYFLDSIPSPNPTSRVLPVIALFEDGTYAIDRYQDTTMDKSFVGGHYYSDKAPLSTWLVLPVYGLLKLTVTPEINAISTIMVLASTVLIGISLSLQGRNALSG